MNVFVNPPTIVCAIRYWAIVCAVNKCAILINSFDSKVSISIKGAVETNLLKKTEFRISGQFPVNFTAIEQM